jgi:hypothetical protein
MNEAATSLERHKAATLIARRGRAYMVKRSHSITVHVFSRDESDMQLLHFVYGGSYRRHSTGFQWTVMRADTLAQIMLDLLPYSRGDARIRLRALYDVHEGPTLARLNERLGNPNRVAA